MKDRLKWAYQRAVRGYDDRLYWGMDEYLDPIILAGLKNLKENGMGYPIGLTEKKWNKVLDTMISGFETDKYTYTESEMKKRKKALVLFAFYYNNLWD
jgi:hypothetical protein